MGKKIKKIIILAVLAAICYFFLSYHIILIGNGVKLLKKKTLTSEYTFFDANNKNPEDILRIENLRNDDIGSLLVEEGILTEKKRQQIIIQIENTP